MDNPLLKPFDTVPFSQIENKHYLPAFKELIETTRSEIDRIANNPGPATFENTVAALDRSGQQLDRVSSAFFNLNSAETNDELQKIAQEVSPLLSDFSNDLLLNKPLFERIKTVYAQRDSLDLTPEEHTLLDKNYRNFARNGANLGPEDQKRLREIDAKLAQLKLRFGENVLAETNAYELHLTRESDLEGLPDSIKEAAADEAATRNKGGWVITLDYPSYIPFMKYAKNRELRRELSLAFGSRAFKDNTYNNEEVLLEIARLRYERARLLGYQSHAHFVLEERMAGSPQKVRTFLEELLEKSKPAALAEFEELQQFAMQLDGIEQLEKWDAAYYAEKLKQQRFDLDDEKLKPYFELNRVIGGVFGIANRLYGLAFNEVFDIDKYHEEVRTYRVTDQDGVLVALFYTDFHPRPGKRNGAWMTSYKPQQIVKGENSRPHISIVCNFSRPTKSTPSLLTFNEVTTLFHEFGHALHGMLANTTYPGLSGTSVYWDFVELPSQILENWCYEDQALNLFARHYNTDQPIPMEVVEKIKESATFHEVMNTLRQLSFGLLDMAWHNGDPSDVGDVKTFENKAFEDTQLYPDQPSTCMSTSFSHIFQGGYSAGYYSYKWAEVLDADAFEYFKAKGVFSREVADKFKTCILSQGGTQDPMELYLKFRGKQPDPEALLRRAGLIASN
jgi:peptidyl-dipeptidase Dcp